MRVSFSFLLVLSVLPISRRSLQTFSFIPRHLSPSAPRSSPRPVQGMRRGNETEQRGEKARGERGVSRRSGGHKNKNFEPLRSQLIAVVFLSCRRALGASCEVGAQPPARAENAISSAALQPARRTRTFLSRSKAGAVWRCAPRSTHVCAPTHAPCCPMRWRPSPRSPGSICMPHSVKLIRWVAAQLWNHIPWQQACAVLMALYAKL